MAFIEKKVWPQNFDKIVRGDTNFEIRLADFELKEGDILILREWDPIRQRFTGRSANKLVKHVRKMDLTKFWDIDRIKKNGIYLIEL